MADWKKDSVYLFHDDERAAFVVGHELQNKLVGKHGSMPWDSSVILNNFKRELATMPLSLHSNVSEEGYKKTNKRLIIVPFFLDNTLARNSLTPAHVENEKLRNENEMLKRMINDLRTKLFTKTGKDAFEEEMLRRAKKSSEIRREFYRSEDNMGGRFGFGGGGGGYLPYYNRFQQTTPQQTPQTEESGI